MKKINEVLKKNYKVLLRNKFSLATMIFGPLLIIFILGFLFNNQNSYNINIGTYISEETDLYQSYISSLENDGFSVIPYKYEKNCVNGLQRGTNNICIIFPSDFKLEDNHTNLVIIKVDPSKKNILSITQNLVLNSLSTQSQIYQINNTQGIVDVVEKNEIDTLNIHDTNLKILELNEKIRKNNNDVNKKLIQLEATFEINDVDFAGLERKATAINSSVQSFAISAQDLISTANSYISNLSSVLSKENTSETSEINGLIGDIEDELVTLNTRISSLKTNYNLKTLQKEITEVSGDLGDLESKINDLNNDIEDIIEENDESFSKERQYLLAINESSTSILNSIQTIKLTDAKSIVHPVEIMVQKEGNDSNTHLSSLIPTLIVSLIFIISIVLTSNFVLLEKENSSFFRNFLTKTSSLNFFLGDFIALLSIIFTQMLIIVSIYYMIFSQDFSLRLLYLLLIIIPVIGVFVLMGMIVGHISNNQSTNIILSFLVIFVFFALSGSILPIELLPTAIKNLVLNNPYIISEGLIRKLIIFDLGFGEIKFDILLLVIYFILLFLLNLFFESITKKRLVYQYYIAFELRIKEKLENRKNSKN